MTNGAEIQVFIKEGYIEEIFTFQVTDLKFGASLRG